MKGLAAYISNQMAACAKPRLESWFVFTNYAADAKDEQK